MAWPPHFKMIENKAATAQLSAAVIACASGSRRHNVVQAGGCSGLWPLALARHFDHVYTFEPDLTNFKCLQHNIAGMENIQAFDFALSDTRRCVGLTRPKLGAGLWRVDGPGDIQAVTLDDFLGDVSVDAIVLDVEGSELDVWRGAERLIHEHRPLLWFEMRKDNAAQVEEWLQAHHYGPPVRSSRMDFYSTYHG